MKYLMMPVLTLALTACSSNIVENDNVIFSNKYEVAFPVRSNDTERIAIGFNCVKDSTTVILKVGYVTSNTGIIKSIGFNISGYYYLFSNRLLKDNEYVFCDEIFICRNVKTPHAEIEVTKDFIGKLKKSSNPLIIIQMYSGQIKVGKLKSPQYNSNAFELLKKIK